MTASPALLQVEGLRCSFLSPRRDPVEAVRGVDFEIAAGEIVGVVGESGSGKTATAMSVLGLLPTSARVAGTVRFAGESLTTASGERMRSIRGNEISMVFQDPMTSLNPLLTVGAHFADVRAAHGVRGARAARSLGIALLEQVGIPDPSRRIDQYPHQLSGGMRQRVMIALALANEPKLLIADEPTTALDVTVQASILRLLLRLRDERGMAIMLVTHDLGVVAETCERMLVMYRGEIVERGRAASVLRSPQHEYTAALLRSSIPEDQPRSARLITIGESGAAVPIAAPAAAEVAPEPSVPASPLLQITDLDVRFPVRGERGHRMVRAVKGVSLEVPRGGSMGIVGESGSGKSTIARAVMGLERAHSGSIRLDGTELVGLRPAQLRPVRRRMQMVFQDPYASLNPRLSVRELIGEPLRVHLGLGAAEIRQRVAELLDQVGLPSSAVDRYPHEFSGGQRQRIGIARAIATKPEIVIADEPVSALDVSIQAQLLNLLKDLQREYGLSYLFISHDLNVVRYMCEEVTVLYHGDVMEQGGTDAIWASPQNGYTRELLAAIPRVEHAGRA